MAQNLKGRILRHKRLNIYRPKAETVVARVLEEGAASQVRQLEDVGSVASFPQWS